MQRSVSKIRISTNLSDRDFSRNRPHALLICIASLLVVSIAAPTSAAQPNVTPENTAKPSTRPNIVLIMIDDLCWSDIGCYGNKFVETPHIDRLAKQGMKFTDFYAAGAVCSPTRAAIQSGQNQARLGITAHIPGHWRPFEKVITPIINMQLPLENVTIGESMQAAGYATGYFGKWHLGYGAPFAPDKQGYETSITTGGHRSKQGEWLTEFHAKKCSEFIEQHREKPFFAMVSPFAVHIPLQAPEEKVTKYESKSKPVPGVNHPVYSAMVEQCDDLVGTIVDTLERLKLTENTVVVFTSDNGGLQKMYLGLGDTVTTNAPLRDEKGSLYEGGIRVPLIVKWPGKIPADSVSAEPTISYDFYPTFVELAGGTMPANQAVDGLSLWPILQNPKAKLNRNAIHFHYPHYHHSRPAGAIRMGDWKLIQFFDDNTFELYNLAEDIGETKNLINKARGKSGELRRALKNWQYEIGAAMPIKNPAYDASRAHEWWSRRTGEAIDLEESRKRWETRTTR